MAVCWPDALNCTFWGPGETLRYAVTAPKASCWASTRPPSVIVTWSCFSEAWMTRTSACPFGAAIASFRTSSRRAAAGPRLATV